MHSEIVLRLTDWEKLHVVRRSRLSSQGIILNSNRLLHWLVNSSLLLMSYRQLLIFHFCLRQTEAVLFMCILHLFLTPKHMLV